jgi:hypothetical protein
MVEVLKEWPRYSASTSSIFWRNLFVFGKSDWISHLRKETIMGKRVFANYYFEVKFGQGAKANKYFEEIKAEALKLGIADVHMGKVEIGFNAPYTYFSLVFESADAFGRQWGSGSENEAKGADWKALWLRLSQEPTQVLERKGSDLIYEQ